MTRESITEGWPEVGHEIVPSHSVKVEVHRTSDKANCGRKILGKLHKLSLGGVQVLLPGCLKFSDSIELRMNVPDAGVKIDAMAEVRWIRPATNDQCLIGCSLATPLSGAVLDRLATAGVIDRRRHPRRAVCVPAYARNELDTDSFPIRITDFGKCGFCMASARPSTLGTALSVQLDPGGTEPPITGTVRWQEKRDGEYAIGCSVNRAEGVEQLCRLCDLSSDSDQGGKPAERYGERVRSTLSLAAVWLLVALGGTVLGLGVINGRHPSTKRWLADRKMISDRKTAEINYRPGHRVALEIETTDSPRLPVVAPLAMQDTTVQRMHGPDTSGLLLVREVSVPDPDVGLEPPPLTTEPDSGATERRLIPLVNEPSVEKVELIIGDHGSVVPSFVRRAAQADPTAPESAASGIARQVRTPTFETRAAATIARVRSDPASRVSGRSNIDLTKAKKALIAGEKYYRADRYDEAIRCFQAATRHDPRSPLHFYLLAMSYYEQRRFGDAGEAAQRAFELERKWPIENRGSRLSRYQGRARMWIERIRSESTASAS